MVMKIEVGKYYRNGPILVKVLKIDPWEGTISVESDCPFFLRDTDGTIPMGLENFEEHYEEYNPGPFEIVNIPLVGLTEVCLN